MKMWQGPFNSRQKKISDSCSKGKVSYGHVRMDVATFPGIRGNEGSPLGIKASPIPGLHATH
jgi:hypothetical protein